TQASDPAAVEVAKTADSLAQKSDVPVYTSWFNVSNLHAQNYLLNDQSLRLSPLGGPLKRGSDALYRVAIWTTSVGIERGRAAVLAKLERSTPSCGSEELALVSTALRLRCIEGAIHSSWQLGQRINGVAFNRIIPIGLLGNMALDTSTGHVLSEDY